MKSIEEIKQCRALFVEREGKDGGQCKLFTNKHTYMIIFSKGGGWEHVSVSILDSIDIPTWDLMCAVKSIFWNKDEAVIQVHPPVDEYVNNVDNCLHLWRCYYKDMVLPPACFVGVKDGQTKEEYLKEFEEAYKIAGEVAPKIF